MTASLKIDFVSDIACPWCAVGLFSLEKALDRLQGEVQVDIHFQPFELNPDMGPGGQDLGEHLTQKYGSTAEQQAQIRQTISARGAEVGFTFAPGGRGRVYNTFDAHRLLTWAEGQGQGAQHRLKKALLAAYQGRAERIEDHEVLLAVVAEVGLNVTAARDVLESDAYADKVRAVEQLYQRSGIHSVPAVIINDQYLISGGQPVEVFEQSLRQIAAQLSEAPGMSAARQPVLFVSHGSPMFAVQPGEAGPALHAWAQAQAPAQQLKGIVLMSPHWMTRGIGVMATPKPETWHDFGGFPPALYELQYPAPGAPGLAEQVLSLLRAAELPAGPDPERPLDHGCWVPLMHLYPEAKVPVVQVALPAYVGPAEVYAVGQALAPLREQGILLVGSGSMTHNLHELRREDGPTEPYVTAFCGWVHDTLMQGDLQAMLDYRAQAPHAARAHPTDEHFLTIYFALGAAGWGQPRASTPQYITRDVQFRSISMDAFSLH